MFVSGEFVMVANVLRPACWQFFLDVRRRLMLSKTKMIPAWIHQVPLSEKRCFSNAIPLKAGRHPLICGHPHFFESRVVLFPNCFFEEMIHLRDASELCSPLARHFLFYKWDVLREEL